MELKPCTSERLWTKEEIRKYFESSNNEYMTNEKLRVITKAMLRGNFTAFK